MALAWGRPLREIEELPASTLAEFKALNLISPFTEDAKAYREGLIATILYNKSCTKKSQTKSISDLFPYLSNEVPDFLEEPKVKKAKDIFKAIQLQRGNKELYEASMAEFKGKIDEEIEILLTAKVPDQYTINKLRELIGGNNGKDV